MHPDGTVVMRTNRLGVFEGAAEVLSGNIVDVGILDELLDQRDGFQVRPRALSRRRTTGVAEASKLAKADGVIEDHVQLPEKWVDEAIFKIPELISWAEGHAIEVAERRLAGQTAASHRLFPKPWRHFSGGFHEDEVWPRIAPKRNPSSSDCAVADKGARPPSGY